MQADRDGRRRAVHDRESLDGHRSLSSSGESDQQIGLAASVRDLWHGKLAALPGNGTTFVPVVPVDYLASFMALVPTVPEADGQSYWVLDDDTAGLPDLLTAIGRHYQVRVPGLRIPVKLVKLLPATLTKADPETLSFMSTDRYPTESARVLAGEHELRMPETLPTILRWADHVAAHRFGAVSDEATGRGFSSHAGIHTFGIGDPQARTIVLPPIPLNADTWAAAAARMSEPVRVLDLPGLGMSAGSEDAWGDWLTAVADGRDDLHLVGHSVGAAVAVEHASQASRAGPDAHADRAGIPPTGARNAAADGPAHVGVLPPRQRDVLGAQAARGRGARRCPRDQRDRSSTAGCGAPRRPHPRPRRAEGQERSPAPAPARPSRRSPHRRR